MPIKFIIIAAFALILFSLGSALFHLVKHKSDENSAKTARALTFRIGFSLALFILIFIAFATGLLEPHGLGVKIRQAHQIQPTSE